MALFTSKTEKELLQNSENSVKNQPVNGFFLSADSDNFNALCTPELEKCLPTIAKGKVYHFPSLGWFSLYQVIARVIHLIGPAKMIASTWAIAQAPLEVLFNLKDRGQITDMHLLLEPKVRTNNAKAWQLASARCKNIGLKDCHAKVTILTNDDYQVVINSSSNLSKNNRIESYVVTENEKLSGFYSSLWLELIEKYHISNYGI